MFRQASRLLARSISQQPKMMARAFSSEVPATPSVDSIFIESWKKAIPNMDPPKTPSAFMQPRPPAPSTIPSKLTVNFVLPYASELSSKEDSQTGKIIDNDRLQDGLYILDGSQNYISGTNQAFLVEILIKRKR